MDEYRERDDCDEGRLHDSAARGARPSATRWSGAWARRGSTSWDGSCARRGWRPGSVASWSRCATARPASTPCQIREHSSLSDTTGRDRTPGDERLRAALLPALRGRGRPGEQEAESARKLDQAQPSTAVSPQECMANLHLLARANTVLTPGLARRAPRRADRRRAARGGGALRRRHRRGHRRGGGGGGADRALSHCRFAVCNTVHI